MKEQSPRLKQRLDEKHDVFLSFSSYNKREVEIIYNTLNEELKLKNKRIWCSQHDLKSGENWDEAIANKINEVQCFVVVLSPESIKSPWVRNETSHAIDQFNDGQLSSVIPFLLRKVDLTGNPLQLPLRPIQKVNENTTNWKADLPKLVRSVCDAVEIDPPRPPGPLQRMRVKVEEFLVTASRTFKIVVGFVVLLVFCLAMAFVLLNRPAPAPDQPTLTTPTATSSPSGTDRGLVSITEDSLEDTPLIFRISGVDPGTQLQLWRNGEPVAFVTNGGTGSDVEVEDRSLPGPGTFDYSARQSNFFGRLGEPSPPLRVRIVKSGPGDPPVPPGELVPPPRVVRPDGVVEISRSTVRGLGANLVSENGDPFAIRPVNAVQHEIDVKLSHTPGSNRFDANSVDQVVDAVEQMINQLGQGGVGAENVRIVMSSGVRMVVEESGLAQACMDSLKNSLAARVGGRVEIEEITPLAEAGYLVKEIIRKHELELKEGRPGFPAEVNEMVGGDLAVIDIGSGTIKVAYYNPGRRKTGRFGFVELANVAGLQRYVPGTRSLVEIATRQHGELGVANEEARRESQKMLEETALSEVRSQLRKAAQDVPMLENSRFVVLTGGAVWAMCRIARPEIDPENLYVEIDRARDINHFRDLLIEQGPGVYDRPQGVEPEFKEALDRELSDVRGAFNVTQLISAGELLNRINADLLSINPNRRVYFVTDGLFDWLAAYLAEKVNRDRDAGQGPPIRRAG